MRWRRRWARHGCTLAVLGALGLGSCPAFAAPPEDHAAKEEGDALFVAKHFVEALARYDEAYAKTRNPALLYNRGRAFEALGRYPEALASIEQFATDAPAALRAKVPKLAELTAELRRHTTRLTVTCNVRGARVVVGERAIGTTPLPSPVVVGAGTATLDVRADGYRPDTRDIELPAGGLASLEVTLEATPTPPSATKAAVARTHAVEKDVARPEPITSRWWFWTGVGVIVVGAAAGIYAAATIERSPSSGDGFTNPQVRF